MNFGIDNPILEFLRQNSNLVPPLWAFLVMYPIWRWVNRDRAVHVSVPTLYEPPQGISPAEAAMLVDNQLDAGDIIATIVDLSLKGYIQIVPRKEKLLGQDLTDYTLTLIKARSSWKNLAWYELDVLDSLFPLDPMIAGATTTETALSGSSDRLSKAVPNIRKEIYRALRKKGFLAVKSQWGDVGLGLCFAMIVLPLAWLTAHGFLHFDFSRSGESLNRLTLLITVGIVGHFGYRMVRKTRSGSLARAKCLSYKDFLMRVDADRLRRLPPEVPKKNLPYAIAFGVEQHYAEACHGLDAGEFGWIGPMSDGDLPTISGAASAVAFAASAHLLIQLLAQGKR